MTQRFSDFAKERKFLDGDKMKIQDIINKEIKVIDAKITHSKYKNNNSEKCLNLQFEFTNSNIHYIVFTGSNVLISQMEQYKDKIPFITTIIQINKFYTFS